MKKERSRSIKQIHGAAPSTDGETEGGWEAESDGMPWINGDTETAPSTGEASEVGALSGAGWRKEKQQGTAPRSFPLALSLVLLHTSSNATFSVQSIAVNTALLICSPAPLSGWRHDNVSSQRLPAEDDHGFWPTRLVGHWRLMSRRADLRRERNPKGMHRSIREESEVCLVCTRGSISEASFDWKPAWLGDSDSHKTGRKSLSSFCTNGRTTLHVEPRTTTTPPSLFPTRQQLEQSVWSEDWSASSAIDRAVFTSTGIKFASSGTNQYEPETLEALRVN